MKKIFTISFILFSLYSMAQTSYYWRDPDAANANFDGGGGTSNWWNGTSGVQACGFGDIRFNNNHYSGTMTNNISSYGTHRFFFEAGATTGRTIASNSIRFYDNGGADPKIENISSASHSFTCTVECDGDAGDPLEINPVNGNLEFVDIINHGSYIKVYGNNSKVLTITGVVSGSGGLELMQDSKIELSGANTYSGNTTVKNGSLQLKKSGGGTINSSSVVKVETGATLQISSNQTINSLTVDAGGTLIIDAGDTLTIPSGGTYSVSGTITNNGTLQILVDVTFPGSATLSSGFKNLDVNSHVTLDASLVIDGNLQIYTGAELTMASNDIELKGNFVRKGSGLITSASMGQFTFNGSSDQDLEGHVTFEAGCVINNTGGNIILVDNGAGSGITIGMKIANSSTLTLTDGNIDSRTNSTYVEVDAGSSVSAGSDDSYIDGKLQLNSLTTSKSFPVGHSGFNPATLVNTGTSDDYTVMVSDFITVNGASGGTPVTSNAVDKTWDVTESVAGGSTVELTLQWNVGDEQGTFNNASCWAAHYSGAAWDPATAGAAGGSGPYTISRSGLTSFSPFAVGSGAPLPVSMTFFTAELNDLEQVNIKWQTASEINSSHFNVYKSIDGVSKYQIGNKPAMGNSNAIVNYSFLDKESFEKKTLYFLEQVDFDGETEWFGPVSLQNERLVEMKAHFTDEYSSLSLTIPEAFESNTVEVSIYNTMGQLVLHSVLATESSSTYTLAIPSLNKGIYIVRTTAGASEYVTKVQYK